jgi:hypothetical protein
MVHDGWYHSIMAVGYGVGIGKVDGLKNPLGFDWELTGYWKVSRLIGQALIIEQPQKLYWVFSEIRNTFKTDVLCIIKVLVSI